MRRVIARGGVQAPLEISRPVATARPVSNESERGAVHGVQGGSLTGQARYYNFRGHCFSPRSFMGMRGKGCCSTGQATLSFVLLIAGIILEVAIAGSIVSYFLSVSGFGERLAARALAAAGAGIEDAKMQIARNKEFAALGATSYTFTVGSDTAGVTVSRTVDDQNGTYLYTVVASGVASSRERRLSATLVVKQVSGAVELTSLVEQPVQ